MTRKKVHTTLLKKKFEQYELAITKECKNNELSKNQSIFVKKTT